MRRALFLIPLFVSAAGAAIAFVAPPEGSVLPDFDARGQSAARPASAPARQESAGVGVGTRRNPLTGLPRYLVNPGRVLSAPRSGIAPEDAARGFLLARPELFRMDEAEVRGLEVSGRIPDARSGITTVFLRQKRDGLRVYGGEVRVVVGKDGAVIAASTGDAIPSGTGSVGQFRLGPMEALAAASAAAGVSESWNPVLRNPGGEPLALYEGGPFSRPVALERVWFPVPGVLGPELAPAWRALLTVHTGRAVYEVVLDGRDGSLLRRVNLVRFAATRGRVFFLNPDADPQQWASFPDRISHIAPESPNGWCFEIPNPPGTDAESSGNNCVVRLDELADDDATPEATAFGSGLGLPWDPVQFDYTFQDVPDLDKDAALTNVFRTLNAAHDWFYRLGFDEQAGNFQVSNLGRGAAEGDPVRADDRDGAATQCFTDGTCICNASFMTLGDGSEARMTLLLWRQDCAGNTGPLRYTSFDGTVVIHEFVHGVTTRMAGGRDDGTCLLAMQSMGMGEGWSDYFAGSFYDTPNAGEYVTWGAGIRSEPMDASGPPGRYTYGEICTILNGTCEVHDVGEVWAQDLWDLRTTLENAYPGQGVDLADRLILTGLRMLPCNPTFVDARDGILAADAVLRDGQDACLIWEAFARGGVGAAASSVDALDQNPVEDFTVPPFCQGIGDITWSRQTYLCADTAVLTIQDSDASPGDTVTVTTSNPVTPDSETFTLAGTGPAWSWLVPISIDPVIPGDGVLQVTEFETITATYDEANPAGQRQTTAVIACTAVVEARPTIVWESCDDDTIPGYPSLPRFLDAGETVRLRVALRNLTGANATQTTGVDLTNVTVQLTTTHPNVAIEPAGIVFVGTLPWSQGSAADERLVDFLLYAADLPPLSTGEPADFELNLIADGALNTIRDMFTLYMNQDYAVEPRSEFWDFESGDQGWSHGPNIAGNDEWGRVTGEGGSTPGASFRNNGMQVPPVGYTDDQDEPHLASPPLDMTPTLPGAIATVGFHAVNLSFQHNVDLRTGRFFGNPADADLVAVLATNPPLTKDFQNPFDLVLYVLAAYLNIPDYGYDSNTGGLWVQKDIPIPPEVSAALDPTQPIQIVWYFWPDASDFFFPCPVPAICNAEGGRYSLDDVRFDYELIVTVPEGDTCTPGTPGALARPSGGLLGPFCPGDAVHLDGGGSVAINCPSGLGYEWRDETGGLVGTNPVLDVLASTNAVYTLTVTCPDPPGATDTEEFKVWIDCGIEPVVVPPPALVCPGDALPLDGTGTVDNSCPSTFAGRWIGPGLPPSPPFDAAGLSTSVAVPGAWDSTWTFQVHRDGDPNCYGELEITVYPDCTLTPVGIGGSACAGGQVTLDATGSTIQNCAGTLEYEWSGPDVAAPAFGPSPLLDVTVVNGGQHTITIRRTDWVDCAAQATADILLDDGLYGGTIGDIAVRRGVTGTDPDPDILLDWSSSSLSPEYYTVVRSDDPQAIGAGLIGQPENAALEIATDLSLRQHTDASAIGGTNQRLWFYAVYAKNRCSREYLDP